ncbi:MAG: hypothetical protein U0935_19570 [Pirellulales bacterium]
MGEAAGAVAIQPADHEPAERRGRRQKPGTHPAVWTTWFAAAALLGVAWGVACAPLGVSVVAVFLFAGPHNWCEARYFLSRLPGRLGPLAPFFAVGFGGTVLLAATFALLPLGARWGAWSESTWTTAIAGWNTALILWIAGLAEWRKRLPPYRDWPWVLPVALLLIAVNWLAPSYVSLALVYLHPILALVFLDRELGRRHSPWRTAYRRAVVLLPVALVGIALALRDAPALAGADVLTLQIQRHAGAEIVPWISPQVLVAWHAYLELLHYGVWVLAVPLFVVQAPPWNVATAPLARRSLPWRRALVAVVAAGALLVVSLWGAFLVDYPFTRDLYFTIALLHVLAEAPMLLRIL